MYLLLQLLLPRYKYAVITFSRSGLRWMGHVLREEKMMNLVRVRINFFLNDSLKNSGAGEIFLGYRESFLVFSRTVLA